MAVEDASAVAKEGVDKTAADAATQAAAQPVAVADLSFADEDAELERLTKLQQQAEGADGGAAAGSPAAAAAAADAGAGATQAATGDAAAAADTGTAAPAAKPPSTSALTRVLIKERERNKDLAAENAQLKGQNQVLTAISRDKLELSDAQLQAAGLAAPAAEKTPTEKIADIDAQIADLAQQYDDATISAKDWKAKETALQNQKFELQTATLRQADQAAPAADLGLEEHARDLETRYPTIATLTAEDLEPFAALAYRQAAREGKPIQDGTATGTRDLRERMAKLATDFYGGAKAAPAAGAPASGQPAAGAKPALSADAQARGAKLDLAAGHPADISKQGSSAAAGAVTEEVALQQLNGFGGDEEAAIRWLDSNPTVKNRVLPATPAR